MINLISLVIALLTIVGCSSTQTSIEETAKKAALIAAKPILEKVFYAEAPIAPSNRELFPSVQNLPGKPWQQEYAR